jgi:formylglycine-generating enzyme required for sulfatase activity
MLEIQVASGSVKVFCNNRQVFAWEGDPKLLTLNDYWGTPNHCIFIGAHDKRFYFHSIVLEGRDDGGLLSRPEDRKAWSLFKVYAMTRRLCSSWGQKDLSEVSRKAGMGHLSRLLASTPGIIETLKVDPTLAPFLAEPSILSGYPSLLARYTYARRTSPELVSTCVFGLSPTQHQDRVRDLVREGYRPVGIDALLIGNTGPAISSSVWHRPAITDEVKDQLAKRQARAAAALLRLGKVEECLPLFCHSADPRMRSFIVNWLSPLGADPRVLAAELDRFPTTVKPTAVKGQQFMDSVLFHPETSQRRALILALGTYGMEGLPPGEREPLIGKLLDLFRNDPDSGIHGAAEWTLRQWEQQDKLKGLDAELMKFKDWGDRRWFVNSQRQTFAVIEGPVEFRMGSPPTDTERFAGSEPPRRMQIHRRFAIAAKEVTVEQFQRFLKLGGITVDRYQVSADFLSRYSPDPQGPWIAPDWYMAAHYCNWLSEQEGLPKYQWCYVPNEAGAYAEGMSIPANVLQRTGYRLPTDAEWEFTCRAGAVTSRYYGHSLELLDAYARYQANSKEHAWRCGSLFPNDLGSFDMLGNIGEWCQDSVNALKSAKNGISIDLINTSASSVEKYPRLLRGGAFIDPPAIVRSAKRDWGAPAYRGTHVGFRPSRTYP